MQGFSIFILYDRFKLFFEIVACWFLLKSAERGKQLLITRSDESQIWNWEWESYEWGWAASCCLSNLLVSWHPPWGVMMCVVNARPRSSRWHHMLIVDWCRYRKRMLLPYPLGYIVPMTLLDFIFFTKIQKSSTSALIEPHIWISSIKIRWRKATDWMCDQQNVCVNRIWNVCGGDESTEMLVVYVKVGQDVWSFNAVLSPQFSNGSHFYFVWFPFSDFSDLFRILTSSIAVGWLVVSGVVTLIGCFDS
jgi:hypothetical protein